MTTITQFLVNTLQIKRGTNTSSYFQLWATFIFSGLMHAMSMLMLPCPSNITLAEQGLGMIYFFLWQAAAITIEDLVIYCWEKVSVRGSKIARVQTIVGFMWVISSMWYSLPFAGDVMMRLRLTEESFLPFTVVGNMIRLYVPIP
jgi:hypothetical protein